MLVIRLFRVGKKNQPSFKIVLTDKRKPPRAGRFVEQIGFWDPLTKEKVLKSDRIKYWLSVGAKLSDTVHNLLVSEKIIEGKKIPVRIPAKTTAGEEKPAAEKPKEEKPLKEGSEAEEKPPEPEPKKEKTPEQKPTEEPPQETPKIE